MKELLGKKLLFFDGGMGTLLQSRGLAPGEPPDGWSIGHPDIVTKVHEQYLAAGSDIILSNTFGVNELRYPGRVKELVSAGVRLAREAAQRFSTAEKPRFTALDIGPTGKLLAPMGDLAFEQCVEIYAQVVREGTAAGADAIIIETMSDSYEVKAAVLAAKENSSLPVIVTMVFDDNARLLTGADMRAAAAMLESLRVDAIGLNCGLGPVQMLPLVQRLATMTSLPIVVKPNAGLPIHRDGVTSYDISPEKFAKATLELVKAGVCAVGGCCGTTPEHIIRTVELCAGQLLKSPRRCTDTVVAGCGNGVVIGDIPVIIGERINPTGKKRFKQALLDNDIDYLLGEGIKQEQSGADILDVNVGMPQINEVQMLCSAVTALQGVTGLPLQLDSSDPKALEGAMRLYNGKPMVNSVNGKKESMAAIFPLVQRYGGVVVALTLDEDGIPATVEGRLAVARKIIDTAAEYGIEKKDILVDALTMTVSAEPQGARVTLQAVERLTNELGVKTVLGVSNISFGLPRRELISSTFLSLALEHGLSAAIINPGSEAMMASYRSYLALSAKDENSLGYIEAYANTAPQSAAPAAEMTLETAVERGLRESASSATAQLLAGGEPPMDIVSGRLIPALDRVGKGFEAQTVYLPQLMLSAEAAKASFELIRDAIAKDGEQPRGEVIILATVHGDIHDIGKNIVKVMLQNYGYDVIDLGKDVPPQRVLDSAREHNAGLVGLSALMTTTLGSMAKTTELLHNALPDCRVMVGGAVLTDEYARDIGASYVCDAMAAVNYAKAVFAEQQ